MEYNKRFSDGFKKDLQDLLVDCVEHDTDTVNLKFDIEDTTLNVDIVFSVDEEDEYLS